MFQLSVSPCHKVVLPTLIAYLMLSSGGVEGNNYFYQKPTPDDVVGVEGNNYLYQIPTPDDVVGVEGNNYFYQKFHLMIRYLHLMMSPGKEIIIYIRYLHLMISSG